MLVGGGRFRRWQEETRSRVQRSQEMILGDLALIRHLLRPVYDGGGGGGGRRKRRGANDGNWK